MATNTKLDGRRPRDSETPDGALRVWQTCTAGRTIPPPFVDGHWGCWNAGIALRLVKLRPRRSLLVRKPATAMLRQLALAGGFCSAALAIGLAEFLTRRRVRQLGPAGGSANRQKAPQESTLTDFCACGAPARFGEWPCAAREWPQGDTSTLHLLFRSEIVSRPPGRVSSGGWPRLGRTSCARGTRWRARPTPSAP